MLFGASFVSFAFALLVDVDVVEAELFTFDGPISDSAVDNMYDGSLVSIIGCLSDVDSESMSLLENVLKMGKFERGIDDDDDDDDDELRALLDVIRVRLIWIWWIELFNINKDDDEFINNWFSLICTGENSGNEEIDKLWDLLFMSWCVLKVDIVCFDCEVIELNLHNRVGFIIMWMLFRTRPLL